MKGGRRIEYISIRLLFMSVIANFQKYYKDVDPSLDLFDVIESIYEWFFRKLWERRIQYMKTGKVIPIDTSDFPGQDFGFMPMETVLYDYTRFRTMYSGKVIPGVSSDEWDTSFQLPTGIPEKLGLSNHYSLTIMGRYTTHDFLNIPIAVNNEWGDILYAKCTLMSTAKDGPAFMLGKNHIEKGGYSISGMTIVNPLKGERKVLYNAVNIHEKYVNELAMYLHSLSKVKFSSDQGMADSHYNVISKKILVHIIPIRNIADGIRGFPFNWYNDLFDLPADTITRALHSVAGIRSIDAKDGAIVILRMQKCFGNALQSVYQTYEKCNWFLPLLMRSFDEYLPYFGEDVSLQKVLGVDKPTLKEILREPTSDLFVFWQVMNLHSPCSYIRAKRLYEKFEKKDAELMVNVGKVEAFDITGTHDQSFSTNTSLYLPARKLSYAQQMYVHHGIYELYSLSEFYKWLLSECYLAVKSKKYARSDFIMAKVLNMARDYHWMAAEINPRQAFTLPHNILLAHDAMVDNYHAHKKEHSHSNWQAASIKRLVPCYRGKRGNCVEDDTYMVCQPMSSDDILDEGIQLHHCVGSYFQNIIDAKGNMLIYFMRLKASPKKSLVTIQVNRAKDGTYYLVEAAGENNRTTTKAENAFIEKWLVAFNENIQRLLSTKGRKNIWFDQCQDDLQVWCQWARVSMERAKRFVGEHPTEENWDSVMKKILVAYAHGLSREQAQPLYLVVDSIDPYIAAMYGLCCMQSTKYRDFEYIKDDD